MRLLIALSFASLLAGCQTSTFLDVYSQPDGAYITPINGTGGGYSPLRIRYVLDDSRDPKDAQGCFLVNGVVAQWSSGAVARENQFRLCGDLMFYNYVINRPANAPNLQADLNVAAQLSAQRTAQANAKAAAEREAQSRNAAALGAFGLMLLGSQPQPTKPNNQTYVFPNGTMNCTTTGTVTNCF